MILKFISLLSPLLFGLSLLGQEPLNVSTLNGKDISIPHKDAIVVIYLWDARTDFSVKEFAALNELKEAHIDQNVIFLAASTEKEEKVRALLDQHEFTFRQVAGKEGKKIMKHFDNNGLVRTFPKHYVINPDGEIMMEGIGSCSTIHEALQSHLVEGKNRVTD